MFFLHSDVYKRQTLEIIFEHFGRLLATNLPAYLRKAVSVDVVNSEVVIYSEFSNALSNPVLLGVVSMAPLSGNMVMEIASNLGFAFEMCIRDSTLWFVDS